MEDVACEVRPVVRQDVQLLALHGRPRVEGVHSQERRLHRTVRRPPGVVEGRAHEVEGQRVFEGAVRDVIAVTPDRYPQNARPAALEEVVVELDLFLFCFHRRKQNKSRTKAGRAFFWRLWRSFQ